MTHRDIRAAMERDWPDTQTRYLAWCHATGHTVAADFDGALYMSWINHHVAEYKAKLHIDSITYQEALSDWLWRVAVEEREKQQTLEGME